MGRSIRHRILLPIALLIVMSLIANIWICVAALHSHRSARTHNEHAFATLQLARNARGAFAVADDFVTNVMEFTVLRHPSEVRAKFKALLQKLDSDIDALIADINSGQTETSFGPLTDTIAQWSSEASIVTGLTPSRAVPTPRFLKELSAKIVADISRIESVAQARASALAAGEREQFAQQIFYAFVIIFLLFSVVALLALWQAGRLAGALKNLLDAMQSIGRGRLEVAIPHCDRPDELGAMARGVAQFADSLSELMRAKEKIEHMALNDALTGLANRRMLNACLSSMLDSSSASFQRLALLHVDLDRFKQVNDVFGHAAGDMILCETAKAMLENVRQRDLVARVGGDEFVIVLDLTGPLINTGELARRVIAALSRPIAIANDTMQVGASIGIAFSDDANGNPERLLANADLALYEAKALGRGRHCVYSAETRHTLECRNALVQELKSATSRDEFDAFFQPQVDGRNGQLVGFEALVRWHHPSRGLLLPGEFIEVAFENGLGNAISHIVLKKAIAAFQHWRSRGLGVKQVSINLSAKQLRDEEFVKKLITSIERSDLLPVNLAIEVVESVLFGDELDPVITNLNVLQERGFPIELDDFGSGHASISNLRKFRVNKIKIDRSFVSGVDTNSEQEVMLKAIIELARNLGIECIAEGVESESERSKLLAMGCAQMQGYGIARPMPFEVTTHWIRAHKDNLSNGRICVIR
jgi:diguanylate cyclase (GGDEF)-like protein